MVRQVVIISIIAIGATFLIIGGGIDLSVGSVLAFCGAVGAKTMFTTGSVMLSGLSRKFGDVFYAERAKSSDCFDSFFNIFVKSSRVNFHSNGFAIFS